MSNLQTLNKLINLSKERLIRDKHTNNKHQLQREEQHLLKLQTDLTKLLVRLNS